MNKGKLFGKMRSGFVVFFLLLVVVFGTSGSAESVYVVDNVNLFSDVELEVLTKRAAMLEERKSAKVMLYVDDEFPIDDALIFAEQKYKEYGISENGVMIVLAMSGEIAASSNNAQIAEKVNFALDSIMPFLEEGKIAEGLFELQGIFIEYFGLKIEETTISTAEAIKHEATTTKVIESNSNKEEEVVKKATHEVVKNPEKEATKITASRNLPILIMAVISMVGFIAMTFSFVVQKKKFEENSILAEQEIEALNNTLKKFRNETNEKVEREREKYIAQQRIVEELKIKLQNSQNEIQQYEENLEVIRIIHPNIVEEMEEYYRRKQEEADKKKAEEFDFDCGNILKDSVTKDSVEPLQNILQQYFALSDSQKQWVTTDCEHLKSNLQKAEELKKKYESEMEERRCQGLARQFENSIRYLQQSAHLFDLEEQHTRVENLLRHYRNEMPKQACDMLDIAYMQAWKIFYENVQREWEKELERRAEMRRRKEEEERRERVRREEEERRRREQRRREEEEERRQREQRRREEEARKRMSSSYSSFSSSKSSSGSSRSFGGSSSGGSRSFGGGKSRGGGAGRSF